MPLILKQTKRGKEQMSINIIHNPITSTALLKLRDKKSHSKLFREGLLLLSEIIAYEAGKKLKTKKVKVKSVLEDTVQESIADDIALIPILRAGLGMTTGFLKVYENAIIAPLGMSRDHETLLPSMYYSNIPENINKCHCFILDPMLATGGSACFAINYLIEQKKVTAEKISLCSITSSPEGLKKIESEYPQVDIYTISKDRELNKSGYILPGLGDAGDRIFNTIM